MTLELTVEERRRFLPTSDVENVPELNSIKLCSNPASYHPGYIRNLYNTLIEKGGIPPVLMSVAELNEYKHTHPTVRKEDVDLFPPSGSVVFRRDEDCKRTIILGRISSEPFIIENASFQRVFITPLPDDEEAHMKAKEEVLFVEEGIEENEFIFLR